MKIVILAGGVGTRLWPMSRTTRPKQFFNVLSEEPLLRDTFNRVAGAYSANDIFVAVSPSFAELVQATLPEIPVENILVEPDRRDTGPAMGFVAAVLSITDPDEPMVFIPSDHYIRDIDRYLELFRVGEKLIREQGCLIDIGVPPTFASTTLGYTKVGEQVEKIDGVSVLAFEGHSEKPPYEIAKKYLDEGSYLWHANYYMWTPKKFLEAFSAYAPDVGEKLLLIRDAYAAHDHARVLELFASLPKISFDYAVTEKMDPQQVRILRGDFGWSDIGAWDTLYDRISEEGKNVTKGNVVMRETDGSLIYASGDRLVATYGVRDLVIVDTEDVVLVCHRESAQQLKDLIKDVEEKHGNRYL